MVLWGGGRQGCATAGLRWLRGVLRGVLLVERAAVRWGRWRSRLAVAVLRWFLLSKVPPLHFLPDFYPMYFYPAVLRVCVCLFVKNGPENMSPWNLRGGASSAVQGFGEL